MSSLTPGRRSSELTKKLRNPEQALREYTKYSEEGVRRILVGAVDVNQCNGANQSPLHIAMANSRPNIVTQLLARPETRLDTVDLKGRTPLHALSTGAQFRTMKCIRQISLLRSASSAMILDVHWSCLIRKTRWDAVH